MSLLEVKNLKNIYAMGKIGIASFAPVVFDAWKSGDSVAADILDRNMAYVAMLIEALGKDFPEHQCVNVRLTGGVAMHQPIIPLVEKVLTDPKHFSVGLSENTNDYGAVRLAMRLPQQ